MRYTPLVVRVSPASKERVRLAAQEAGLKTGDFARRALDQAADAVLVRRGSPSDRAASASAA